MVGRWPSMVVKDLESLYCKHLIIEEEERRIWREKFDIFGTESLSDQTIKLLLVFEGERFSGTGSSFDYNQWSGVGQDLRSLHSQPFLSGRVGSGRVGLEVGHTYIDNERYGNKSIFIGCKKSSNQVESWIGLLDQNIWGFFFFFVLCL
ncbi:hypothetical protein HanIR_Chr01g0030411 [Helianthus annuus]|nr:hypothetical protein HanIR_Chr01g0030411 [Helianthus annuus]